MSALKSLFTLDGRVRRAQYLAAGFGLGIFKYVVDAGLRLAVTGEFWEPLDYLDPRASHRLGDVDAFPTVLIVWLIVWTLPFVWVGVVMSARRARDVGRSPWWGLAFLVPVVHFLVIAVLAVLPTRESQTKPWKRGDFTFRVAIFGVAATTLLVMGMVALMTEGMDYYGVGLFFTAPFLKFPLVCAGVTLVLLASYQLFVRYTPIGTFLNGPRRRAAQELSPAEGRMEW